MGLRAISLYANSSAWKIIILSGRVSLFAQGKMGLPANAYLMVTGLSAQFILSCPSLCLLDNVFAGGASTDNQIREKDFIHEEHQETRKNERVDF